MLNQSIKQILDNCIEKYSAGDFYKITEADQKILLTELGINVDLCQVTDNIFDLIYYTAKDKWPDDEYFNQITSTNDGFGVDIIHEIPMGSMEELKAGDWDKWNKGHNEYWISSKLDGCSLILTYENGKLEIVASRGHGTKGKDCMRHVPFIQNIPYEIPYTEKVIIRGELICPKADIPVMLAEVEQKTGQKLKNGRNTIAGALNKKESMRDVFKYAHFVAYWDSLHQAQDLNWIKEQGFEVPLFEIVQSSITEDQLKDKIQEYINKSIYELDGIIITQKDNAEEGLETGTLNPKCSRKLKIGINISVKETKLLRVEWNPSKNGRLAPVVWFEPIELDGSVVQKATGVNKQFMENLGIYPGCTLLVRKAGAVIPQIVGVIDKKEDYNGLDASLLPEYYTQKGLDLYQTEESAETDIKRLEYFGKKLGIEQLGYGNCHKLYFYRYFIDGHKLSPHELFDLSLETLVGVIGENGNKIYKSILEVKQNLTECILADACGAFGPQIGEKVLQKVYDKYHTLYVSAKDLLQVDGFGNARIEQYMQYVLTWQYIESIIKNCYHITFKENNVNINKGQFTGKVICFTGIRDKEFAKYLIENGADVSDNWKSTTNILVAKDPNKTSNKIEKAKNNNCTILTLEEAYEYFNYK